MQADEAEIRQRIERLVEAIRAMDVERAMSIYSQDIVSFDLEPPLQHVGAAEKRKNWLNAFSMYQPPLGYDISNLTIRVGGDVAFGHGFIRTRGTLKNGNRIERWLRSTMCFRKIDGQWLIVHDQISPPVDPASGKALLDLRP